MLKTGRWSNCTGAKNQIKRAREGRPGYGMKSCAVPRVPSKYQINAAWGSISHINDTVGVEWCGWMGFTVSE
jgi:hypothetical protein